MKLLFAIRNRVAAAKSLKANAWYPAYSPTRLPPILSAGQEPSLRSGLIGRVESGSNLFP
jgi:hypothetical protein